MKLTTRIPSLAAAILPLILAPAVASAVTVSTAIGNGADAQISEQSADTVFDTGDGTGVNMNARSISNRNEMIYVRFDLSAFTLADLTNVTLNLISFRDSASGDRTNRLFGVNLDATPTNGSFTPQNWDEGSIVFSTAPGVTNDGDSTTQGLDLAELTDLGEINTSSVTEGQTITWSGSAITNFINSYAGSSVTFLVAGTNPAATGQLRIATKEADALDGEPAGTVGAFAPYLQFDVIPEPGVATLLLVGLGALGASRRTRRAARK